MIRIKREKLNSLEQFKKDRKLLQRNIELCDRELEKAKNNLEITKKKYGRKSIEYRNAYIEVQRYRYEYERLQLASRFIRPNNEEDILYRRAKISSFDKELRNVISKELDLRFHGTPIYFAEQIIKSGEISSSADRYGGYISSTDPEGEFSVSDISNLYNTIALYTDLTAYQKSLPCGCVFALFPAGMEDEMYPGLMYNVNIKRNPDQLFGIFTTPENIMRVRNWMQEAKLDSEKVFTFEEFKQFVQEQSELINSGEEQVIPDFENVRGISEIRKITNSRTQKRVNGLLFALRGITNRREYEGKRGER